MTRKVSRVKGVKGASTRENKLQGVYLFRIRDRCKETGRMLTQEFLGTREQAETVTLYKSDND